MIGAVVPAHDEEALIGRALQALRVAAAHPDLQGEEVRILVVLDACRDQTGDIAHAFGAQCLAVDARNVGFARAAGAQALIEQGARWLAFTDADSVVAPCWFSRQLALRSEAVCGVVEVDDWTGFTSEERSAYEAGYFDAEDHRHIHGANLGVSVSAYQQAGGFPTLCTREDVALVERLHALGVRIAWTNTVRVLTSARQDGRAPDGFSTHLGRLRSA
ncbi:glycosyltransferase [Roseateles chitinivorans]|uniref:glycosyltransferase n=1 Tax=Roseateles chitinivorans TaxID=2917965 RepID=UPI003D675C1A